MTALSISPDLSLPIDAVTETFWFTGKRGSGKTHNCSVMVEEMLRARAQVVILDPMSAWWGLRSSVDGKSAGFPIAIFGGSKGDLPLESSAGAFMAELAVTERVSMILDVKAWNKTQRRRFVTDFLSRLLAINEEPMHVVLEEAARFAPQRPQQGDQEMLGACMDLVQLGRGMGLGASLVSQRSATINKEVSSQTSVLVAHRTVSKADRVAMHGWFEFHESEAVSDADARLPRLDTGSGLIASTELFEDDVLREVRFRPRETFDSSATPKVGEAKREAKTLADIDLGAIGSKMTETVERAKANDPKELKTRIVKLEHDLAAASKAETVTETVEVEVVREVVPAKLLDWMEAWAEAEVERAKALTVEIGALVARFRADVPTETRTTRPPRPPVARPRQASVSRPVAARAPTPADVAGLGKGETKILTATAQHPDGVTRSQLTVLTDYKRSSRDTYLQRLRSAGLVEQDGDRIHVTGEGLDVLGDFDPLPTGAALRDYYLSTLPAGEAAILSVLVDAWPAGVDRDAISDVTEYKRSSRDTYIQRLKAREIIRVDRDVFAADHLFEET